MNEVVAAVQTASQALLTALDDSGWTDADLRQLSLVPPWTRAHVLTHLARNADGIADAVEGSLRGEDVPRYPYGDAGRDADIESGSDRLFAEIRADLGAAIERLDGVFAAVDRAGPITWEWYADGTPNAQWPHRRLRELEIHRVDLDAGYSPADWPDDFVVRELPDVAHRLSYRRGVAALRLVVTGAGPAELDSRVWEVGDQAAATEVSGPAWALLAWLTGRPTADAAAALSAVPELPPWT